MRTVILQRVVPHFRAPLFERLHNRLGWIVATGSVANDHGFNLVPGDPPWMRRFDFRCSPRNQYRTTIPVEHILRTTQAEAVVAEFSLSMSSTWRLSLDATLRRTAPMQLAFWSHGPNVERGFRRPTDLAAQALRLGLLSAADAHVCYSSAGSDYLRRWLPGCGPVFTAQNTVDVETCPGRSIDRSPTDPATPALLFVGRLTPDKRVPMLVEAFAELRRSFPAATLTIVGDGPDMALVRQAAAQFGGAIRLPGAIYDPAHLAREFQAASLFVYAGSIGLAANHALAYGLPVVVFEDPGRGARHHPEHAFVIEGVTGYRVADPSALEFGRRLTAIFMQKQLPRVALGPTIAEFVHEHLYLDRMVSAFADLNCFFREQRASRPMQLVAAE